MSERLSGDVSVADGRVPDWFRPQLARWRNLSGSGIGGFCVMEDLAAAHLDNVILSHPEVRPCVVPILTSGALYRRAESREGLVEKSRKPVLIGASRD